MPAFIPVYSTLLKKGNLYRVGSLASVEVEIFSEAHVVVISVDVLAPTIEKLMKAKKL
jgi:hypothetical protein